jgi:flagellar biosynthetic protein FliR
MFVEAGVGLLLGFVCRIVFFAVDFAGGIAATEMGLSAGSLFNPADNAVMGVPSTLLYWMTMMIFLSTDMHHWLIAAFQRSYMLVPPGGGHLSERLLEDLIMETGQVFRIGVQIMAPIMAVSFMITLVFSTLSRAVPQVNVFSDSFSVRTLVGMLVFGTTCTLMSQHIENYLRHIPEDMLRVARLLGHA